MKNFHASFLYPLALVALSFAPAFAGGRECLASSIAQKLASQSRVDYEVQVSIDLAQKRKTILGQIDAVQVVVVADSQLFLGARGECLIAGRLAQEIAELRSRAQRYLVHAWEVEALQREIVLARLERAMIELKERFSNGEMAEDEYSMAINTLQTDATMWFEQQGVVSFRERLQNAIFDAQQAAGNAIAVMQRTQTAFLILYEARVAAAAHSLREHVASGKVTKRDFVRFEELTRALDALRRSFVPYDC